MELRSSVLLSCVIVAGLCACDDPGIIGFGGAGGAASTTDASTASSGSSGSGTSTAATGSATSTSSGSMTTSSTGSGCTPIDDGLSCTTDTCVNGAPENVPDDAACDDGIACTTQTCAPLDPGSDGVTGCVIVPDDAACRPGEVCEPGPGPTGCVAFDTCPPALDALDGGTVAGDTSSAVDDYAPSCAVNGGMHPDLAYTLTLAADSDVILEVAPVGNHAVSVVLAPVEASSCGAEILCAAPASGEATLEVKNLAAGTYAIVVDGTGAAKQSGAFDLTVLTQASTIGPGDLVINEVMADGGPGSSLNTSGEWVEIANPGTIAVGTSGLTLGDGTMTVASLKSPLGTQIIVAPGGYILGMNSLTPASNGGIGNGDFKISFGVNNTAGDVFRLAKGATSIDIVDTTAANPNGAFPTIGADGVSLQLDPAKKTTTLNDNRLNWCNTPSAMFGNTGGKGTPRGANQSCSAPMCTVATQAADCNDGNPATQDLCVAGLCTHM